MEEKKNKTPDRQLGYQKKYDAKHECFNIRFPEGTKERVMGLGYKSVSRFAIMAVAEKLDREEQMLGKKKQ